VTPGAKLSFPDVSVHIDHANAFPAIDEMRPASLPRCRDHSTVSGATKWAEGARCL